METEQDKFARQMEELKGYAPDIGPGEQGSTEWLYERVGKATGSEFENIMAERKDKKEAAPRYNYRMELVIERITGQPSDRYVSKYMEWGTLQEPAARMVYEARTGNIVMQPGFRNHHEIPMCGGSVDGTVGDDGIIEIKCPTTFNHIETILHGMPEEHIPQVQGYLWITGRAWADFISYDPRLPENLCMHIQRIPRDEKYIADLSAKVIVFLAEVDALHQALIKIGAAQVRAVASPTEPDSHLSAAPSISNQI